ncbi:MAG TPA: hypothetical protein VF472_07770 [Burkholderiaceae bacterium]
MPADQASPQTIQYSLPTISDDLPPLEAPMEEPSGADMFIEEDMWSQIEFFAGDRLDGIRHMLAEYSGFERANRSDAGWRQIYVRRIARTPVIAGASAVAELEAVLGLPAGRAPLIYSSQKVSGKVRNGFCFKLEGNVSLYGHADERGIATLGATLGYMADSTKLTDAFTKLHAAFGIMLVDWCAQVALVAVNANGQIDVLRP